MINFVCTEVQIVIRMANHGVPFPDGNQYPLPALGCDNSNGPVVAGKSKGLGAKAKGMAIWSGGPKRQRQKTV